MLNLPYRQFTRVQLVRAFSYARKPAAQTFKKDASTTTAPKIVKQTAPSPAPTEAPAAETTPKMAAKSAEPAVSTIRSLGDSPVLSSESPKTHIDWSDSFHGLGAQPFPRDVSDVLLAPLKDEDIEIKPDGLLYLPEIKYRRILNRAFGPGGWGLAPRTETLITPKQISREYALIAHGRLVSVARGEQDYFGGDEKITTALEGCKSNALMRCCKDLGIASELWDPTFIRRWKSTYCDELFAEHAVTKRKKKLWKLKKNKEFDYPYKRT